MFIVLHIFVVASLHDKEVLGVLIGYCSVGNLFTCTLVSLMFNHIIVSGCMFKVRHPYLAQLEGVSSGQISHTAYSSSMAKQ